MCSLSAARSMPGPGRGRSGTGEERMLSIRRAIVAARNPSQIPQGIAAEPVLSRGRRLAALPRFRCPCFAEFTLYTV